jgi:hypothetical protein
LEATVYERFPFPVPGRLAAIEIHELLVETVHAHGVVTTTLKVPPAAGTDWFVGEIE